MPVEFIGFITNNNASETIVRSGPVLDPPYIETVAKAHELAGFDRARLADMAVRARSVARPDAAAVVADCCLEVAA